MDAVTVARKVKAKQVSAAEVDPCGPLQAPLRPGVLELQPIEENALVICIDDRVRVQQELGEAHRAHVRRQLSPSGGELDREIVQSAVR